MACKNCKNKTSKYLKELNNMGADVNFNTEARKKEIFEKTWDVSMGKLKLGERFVVIFLAWIPLMVGYFTIVKFIISLF